MRTILMAVSLVATGAAAQNEDTSEATQTAQSAQRFLQLVSEQMEIRADPTEFGLDVIYRVQFNGDEDICSTRVSGAALAYYSSNSWRWIPRESRSFSLKELNRVLEKNGLTGPPWIIDWRHVGSVGIFSNAEWPNRIIKLVNSEGTKVMYLPDEATTKRLYRAMRFLKDECDATVETGF